MNEIKLKHDEYFPIRDDMREALERYLNHGILPGGFLTSCLENDFVGAAGRADHWNKKNLDIYAGYIYNNMPLNSWGSKEKVQDYLKSINNN